MRKVLCGISAHRTTAKRDTSLPKISPNGISLCINIYELIFSKQKKVRRKHGIANPS